MYKHLSGLDTERWFLLLGPPGCPSQAAQQDMALRHPHGSGEGKGGRGRMGGEE